MNNHIGTFDLDGLDELDTQLKLYQLGVESFSPYASSGKVDMIIRSEDGKNVRYADIKVSSAKKEAHEVVWNLEISFFMKNDSFIILAVRLPEADGSLTKHHFIINSKKFLKIAKKCDLKIQNDAWIITIPISDLQVLNNISNKNLTSEIARMFKKYFNNWEPILEWYGITE